MKVAVITRHAVSNYGSLLQAIATQQVIENLGYDCEIIDYIRYDETYAQYEKTILKSKPKWDNNPLKKAAYLALRQPESVAAGRKFEKWRKEYLKLTRHYSSPEQLASDKPDADVYMTGSDQVWGPVGDGSFDSSYCLSFTDERDKRIAYAASFGRSEMNDESVSYYRKWLSRYNDIAVREESAVQLLDGMDIKSSQVIDPTLLLDNLYWNKYVNENGGGCSESQNSLYGNTTYGTSGKLETLHVVSEENGKRVFGRSGGGYILIYQLHNDEKLGHYAKKVADSMSLPLIRVSASFHQFTREGKFVWCPNIGEFLTYIKNARCMITDSFHGTAFALNFNTPFVEVLPNNNTRTRNISILKLTGLVDRILQDDNDVALAIQMINYEKVNKVISDKRQESISILKKMLGE